MRKRLLEYIFFIFTFFVNCQSNQEPLGVHILYGADPTTELNIIWWTKSISPSALVYYSLIEIENENVSIDSLSCPNNMISKGYLAKNSTNGKFIQRVYLRNLKPNRKYCYEITSGQFSSNIFFFRTAKLSSLIENNENKKRSTFVVQGSDKAPNGDQINSLKSKVYKNKINGFINLPKTKLKRYIKSKKTKNYDFFDYYSDILSNVQIIPTVSQSSDDISNSLFQNMLPLKGTTPFNSYYYSIDINGVHFISYSENFFNINKDSFNSIENQIDMIEKDLILAENNRKLVPWIVILVSYTLEINKFLKEKIENIFYHYNVDLILESSTSLYERTYPVIKSSKNYEKSYENTRMPIYISIPKYSTNKTNSIVSNKWSAYSCNPEAENSYGYIEIVNGTDIKWSYVYSNNSLIDELHLKKVNF